jgi:hypothetical protein
MVLQSSGQISMSNIATEFGGNPPLYLSNYYAGAASGFVPAGLSGVPSSGQLQFSAFYGKAKAANGLYNFSTFTFTNASATGRTGPTLSACRSAYSGTAWTQNTTNNWLNMTTQGIQLWTVPATGSYNITCAGAAGGSSSGGGGGTGTGGTGAVGTIAVSLTQSNVVSILVGQMGSAFSGMCGGGGGGSFVVLNGTTRLIISGGGGGAELIGTGYNNGPTSNKNASTSSQALAGKDGETSTSGDAGAAGSGGSGGGIQTTRAGYTNGIGSAGAGWSSGGAGTTPVTGGVSFSAGGTGGSGGANGGFGGGGAADSIYWTGAGGGGGYSGGGGGSYFGVGGGGGSWIVSALSTSTNTGHGYVTITPNFTITV